MGKLERIVLLVVLFGAAIVLALTLNRSKDVAASAGPLDAAQARLDERAATQSPPGERAAAQEPEPGLLLHAGGTGAAPSAASTAPADAPVTPVKPASAPADDVAPPAGLVPASPGVSSVGPASDGRILKSTLGLEPSILDEYKVYTVAQGDTWAGLAQRFYQDGRYTRNLHLANEDLTELEPGAEILVPIYDFLQDAGEEAGAAGEAGIRPVSASAALVDAGPSRASAMPDAATRTGTQVYVVQPGDSLSEIALAVYGSATRWPEILEANQGLLEKPEQLQVGMKLQIPGDVAPAKLAALQQPPAKEKTAPKPAADASAKKPTGKPKKKVQ